MTIDDDFLRKAAQKRRRINLLFLLLLLAMVAGGVMYGTGFFYQHRSLSHWIAGVGVVAFAAIYFTLVRDAKGKK